ncbi:hypothetical protein B0H13DRAFT_2662920 [Mycena leptocephala]|nr:hypothetical protein B0H13DRAFT_2662920 [Mycena leptocephala]
MSLKNERESAQARLDAYAYPVLTLPNEIVSEIFICFLPDYPLCPPVLGLLSPNLLTHICRLWRQIALTTPALWRAISLYYLHCDFESHIHMLRSWLDRSGNCPLSITMDDYDAISHNAFLEAILPHRARWEYVQLVIMRGDLLVIEGPMPLVRSLDIKVYEGNTPVSSVALEAPRLRTATLWDFDYPPCLLPWSHLTSLTLVAKEPYECAYVLEHSANLVYCELILYNEDDSTQAGVDITLPRLEDLVLWKWLGIQSWLTGYLETFVAPALRRLQVPDEFLGPDPIHALNSFVSKSGCKLEEVLITGSRARPKDSYRRAFPSINFSFNGAITDWADNKDAESPDESDTAW